MKMATHTASLPAANSRATTKTPATIRAGELRSALRDPLWPRSTRVRQPAYWTPPPPGPPPRTEPQLTGTHPRRRPPVSPSAISPAATNARQPRPPRLTKPRSPAHGHCAARTWKGPTTRPPPYRHTPARPARPCDSARIFAIPRPQRDRLLVGQARRRGAHTEPSRVHGTAPLGSRIVDPREYGTETSNPRLTRRIRPGSTRSGGCVQATELWSCRRRRLGRAMTALATPPPLLRFRGPRPPCLQTSAANSPHAIQPRPQTD